MKAAPDERPQAQHAEQSFSPSKHASLSKRERDAIFRYLDYEVFVSGTYSPGQDTWRACVCIRRKNGSGMEQNFYDHTVEFESHLAAQRFASDYARKLIDGLEPGLRI